MCSQLTCFYLKLRITTLQDILYRGRNEYLFFFHIRHLVVLERSIRTEILFYNELVITTVFCGCHLTSLKLRPNCFVSSIINGKQNNNNYRI